MGDSLIKPYGDRLNDGQVQLSFTLPIAASPEAQAAAVELATKMGLEKVLVATMEAIDREFTFFVVYGKTTHSIDMSQIKVLKRANEVMNFDEINAVIAEKIKRKLVVIGACIGSDAHTVGIDAIFNMKGFAGDWGLERYPWMEAHNLRAQVESEDLVKKVIEYKADAVLVSRVVTQRDEHIREMKHFLALLRANPEVNQKMIVVCGGPRIGHEDAVSWGYDSGFGPGSIPSHVASFIVYEYLKRNNL